MGYRQILLDFDGVVCDSNGLKEMNILKAAEKVVSRDVALQFQQYFTSNNGIPREIKINHFFKDAQIAESILQDYEALNKNLVNASLVPGIETFLESNKAAEITIISGGVESEIKHYLQQHNLDKYIARVLCGPKTKEENLQTIAINESCVFIGDSLHDFEVAEKFSVDFIFIYGYTQFTGWSTFNFPAGVLKYKDFDHLN